MNASILRGLPEPPAGGLLHHHRLGAIPGSRQETIEDQPVQVETVMAEQSKDARYDAAHPRVTVRLTADMKAKLQEEAKAAQKNVSEVILERIGRRPSAIGGQVSADEVRDNVLFMFEFFQENAANLDITEGQRERFVKIYEWMQKL